MIWVSSHFNPLPPHGGRLTTWTATTRAQRHFNPLPPHGGRHSFRKNGRDAEPFQSTPSAWRETDKKAEKRLTLPISIHSLRMEGDILIDVDDFEQSDFNPLPPHGGRHGGRGFARNVERISIHSLRMEGDLTVAFWVFLHG